MTTARAIIQDALINIGVLDPREAVAATEADFALRELNRMKDRLNLSKSYVYTYTRHVFPLVANDADYTFGDGGNFNTVDAGTIRRASTLDTATNVELPISLIDYRAYAEIPDKTSTGVPLYLYDSRTAPLNTLYLWPVPSSTANSLVLYTEHIGAEFATLDTEVSIPAAYEELIMTELALVLCGAFQVPPSEVLVARNRKAWSAITTENTMRLEANMSPHFRVACNEADIRTGRLV